MEIINFTVTNLDDSTTEWVSLNDGATLTSMTKATYDAQITAQSTLPSNSAIDEPVEKPKNDL